MRFPMLFPESNLLSCKYQSNLIAACEVVVFRSPPVLSTSSFEETFYQPSYRSFFIHNSLPAQHVVFPSEIGRVTRHAAQISSSEQELAGFFEL